MYKIAPHKPNHSIEPTKPKLSLLVPLSTLCLISLSNKANNHQQQQPFSKKTRTKNMASISKRFFSFLFVIIFSLLGFVGFSQGRKLSGLSDQEGTGGGSGASMQCVQKLIPCQPFLKAPEKAPAACCSPLKQMVSHDTKCLCSLFNNPGMLSNLNITQDDALKLPKACGANADISICEKDASSSTPPAATPASNNSSSSSSSKSAAYAPSHFGGSGFAAFFMALIITFTAF